MILRYFRIKTIIFCLSLFLFQPALCGNELTREKAKEILVKQYPQDDYGVFFRDIPSFAGLFGIDEAIYKEMNKIGLIKLLPSKRPTMSKEAILTDNSKQFLIKQDKVDVGGILLNNYYVKTGIYRFGDITGIANMSANIAKVEYTVILGELTPFGPILGATAGTINESANFMLYDDGWRIVDKE